MGARLRLMRLHGRGAPEKAYRSETVSSRCFAVKGRARCCQVDAEEIGSASDEGMTQPSDLDTRRPTPHLRAGHHRLLRTRAFGVVEEQFVQMSHVAQPGSPALKPPSVVQPERLILTAKSLHTTP